MGAFFNKVKSGAAYSLGDLLVTAFVLGIGGALLYGGYTLYKSGSANDEQGKKVGGIVLMVLGALPLLGFVASGFALGVGSELASGLFDDN